jgi:hypothetical protein
MSAAQRLLDRLERVKQTGPGRWVARCPAHEDRSPSLSIRELGDGRVLVHDFGGCETRDVLAAVGSTLAELYEAPLGQHFPPSHSGVSAHDRLEVICHEVLVAALIVDDIVRAGTVDAEQRARLTQAAARIGKARNHGS